MSTHYMEEADEFCSRLAILDHGRVLAMDTPAGLKASTGTDTVVTVSTDGDLDELAGLLHDGIGGATAASVVDHSVLLEVEGTRGVLPAVIQLAETKGHPITDLAINEPTLETVFIKLTGRELRE